MGGGILEGECARDQGKPKWVQGCCGGGRGILSLTEEEPSQQKEESV